MDYLFMIHTVEYNLAIAIVLLCVHTAVQYVPGF